MKQSVEWKDFRVATPNLVVYSLAADGSSQRGTTLSNNLVKLAYPICQKGQCMGG